MLVRARPFLKTDDLLTIFNSDISEHKGAVQEFESTFANTVGVSHCYAVDQGRVALFLALKSLNIKPGDEIIVQSLICAVVIDAIVQAGAVPVLVDSSLVDFNILVSDIEKKISSKTKAIIVVHLYGVPADIEDILDLARQHSCYVIEDCAHTITASYNDKNVGSFGDISFFSFNFDKPISTGNGGMLVVKNPDLVANVQNILEKYRRVSLNEEKKDVCSLLFQHYLTDEKVYRKFLPFNCAGDFLDVNPSILKEVESMASDRNTERFKLFLPKIYKSRFKLKLVRKLRKLVFKKSFPQDLLMNSLRSRIGTFNLKQLDIIEKRRYDHAKYYRNALKNCNLYQLPQVKNCKRAGYLRFTIVNQTRFPGKIIFKEAIDQNVELGNYNWPKPIHLQSPYRKLLTYDRSTLHNSEFLAEKIIHLPTHYYVNNKDREKIVDILLKFTEEYKH